GYLLADRRAERVRPGADVPRAEGKAVGGLFRCHGHSSFLPRMPIPVELSSANRVPRVPHRSSLPNFRLVLLGCPVTRLTISCDSCGRVWAVASAYSLYEQLAVESCPCPQCGAYTLCLPEPAAKPAAGQVRRLGRWPHAARTPA